MSPAPSVKKETLASGVRWSAASGVGVQIGRIGLLLALSRILSPSDFGLVSLVMIIVAFVDVAIGDVGTAAAIVQRQDLTDDEVSTMFWFNVAVGVVLTGLAQLLAPYARFAIDHPDVVPAFRVVAFAFAVAALRMAHQAVLRKNLQYRTLALLDGVAFAVNLVVALSLALAGAGFWALIFGTMAANITLTIGVWLTSGFRPTLTYRWAHLRSVAAFSLNLSAYRFVTFFSKHGDRFLIGSSISADALGFYSQANNLVRYPLDTTTKVYRRVLVPAMARDQDDNARVRTTFLRSTGVVAVAVVPFTLLVAVLAEPMILALVGEKWLPVVPLARILAVVGLIQTVSGQTGVIFHIKGRTDLLLYWGITASVITTAGYVIGLNWGVEGVAWGYLIAMSIIVIPSYYLPMRLIETPIVHLIMVFRGIALAGSALVTMSYLLLRVLGGPDTSPWIPLLAGSAGGGLAYLAVLLLTRNQSLIDLVQVVSPKLSTAIARPRQKG